MEIPLIPPHGHETDHDRGPMLASLSNAIVGLYKLYYGKGPTKARSYYLDDMVLCVLRGGLTRAEQTLAKSGRADAVARQRQEFRAAVRDEFIETVERIVGRRVVAFMSNVHTDPDVNVEIFMLERGAETE
ncbi:MAG TPA: DUF2294 domain-containing protein [Thermoleophilaceae bacterium]|nr:DUF2294 domain-containing protein [Thermoleophilaceae bacterium]